ncbi:unnamed protein product [Durusdinium trenchii]|uniref:Uncharacterized protein n=1 Tax=Durusdinium trenchii TaxID=1381693 RepID=A0ABP0SSF4_9DINO
MGQVWGRLKADEVTKPGELAPGDIAQRELPLLALKVQVSTTREEREGDEVPNLSRQSTHLPENDSQSFVTLTEAVTLQTRQDTMDTGTGSNVSTPLPRPIPKHAARSLVSARSHADDPVLWSSMF